MESDTEYTVKHDRYFLKKTVHTRVLSADINQCNVRLEVLFRETLTHTVNLICYSVFDSVTEISYRRQILMDYH